MLGYDWPRFHAAVNDLPAALLFTTVLFDVAAGLTKRASLQAAALWTLWAGVVGGWVAALAGRRAEDVIEHRAPVHDLTETPQTPPLPPMGSSPPVLPRKLFRRARPPRRPACGPRRPRDPPFQPYPQAPALVINARPARVIAVLDSLVAAESLQVTVTSPRDGYLETAWYDTAAKTSHATWDDVPNLATTVKIRCWADPYVPGESTVRLEAVYRPRSDPSRTERDLEVVVPKETDR